ncbi:hypothetical protein SJ05684_c07400 [Sinorhizobium sojae CCBAU 05684]|uniref:Uncharacterized protein n=1 Tax=Sinorhizobium sojae CCBAU 05684 TaxID=716928 RepID=A0A249P8E6_9HYPH|nr:hypothetical protein SJ05684_c07400 [Sinorhizobium sojae CCBAU 05684]
MADRGAGRCPPRNGLTARRCVRRRRTHRPFATLEICHKTF